MKHADHIAFRARLEPDRPAMFWRGEWISYAELDQGVETFAARMLQQGVKPGDRVSILSPNHPVHLHALYAAMRYGWIHAPLNYRLPPLELAPLIGYLGANVLVYAPGFEEHARLAAQLGVAVEPVTIGSSGEHPPSHAWDEHPPSHAWDEHPSSHTVFPHANKTVYNADSRDDQIVMLLFTGGTTGVAKAAMVSKRMFETNIADTLTAWGLTPDDCSVIATPMFHAGVNALCTPLLAVGGRVALLEAFNPTAYLQAARDANATIHFAVPTMFQMLVQDDGFADFDWSGAKYAITGGSPCPEPVREAFKARGVRFKLGYGMTEVGVNCFAITLEDAGRNPASVGFPMLHLQAVIRGADDQEVAPGEVGELTLSGPQVCAGYWNKPLETTESFRTLADGHMWLFTGDLAKRDDHGRHVIVGRRKEMFISGGENVYPAEIERVLYDHAGILECAVMGVPDARWGEVGLACVVSSKALEPDALRAFLKSRLAGYKVPKHITILESLPKSAAGKVLKNDLARAFLEQRTAGTEKEETA
jgi:fatty-acyl-CoA synthase